ncbi:ImmA/IrrE family metallo-endopeptidase [Flavobacterium microcysteis]|uniref:Peptidase M48 domain-containing protein n=1 Tax=Flavobacterium microcysteis TaxID=2596891 RepID=A0A501QEW7_9FLAO|nr:hypothetical protein [Flavobacterium microcysteis]TPD70536.1 hypothetical protein FJA49_06255 [Flavobacterium microcysteis]
MQNKNYTYSIILFLFSFASLAQNQNLTLKGIFDREYENFLYVTKDFKIKIPPLLYSVSEQSHLSKDNLVINLNQIEPYTKDKGELFKQIFARFVLGHEIGHVLQHSMFDKIVFEAPKGELQIYFECFADVIAGTLFSLVTHYDIKKRYEADNNFNFEQYNKGSIEIMNDAYQQILLMDSANVVITSHPTNIQRMTAFRNGKIAGMIDYTQRILADPELYSALPKEHVEQQREIFTSVSTAMGYNISDKDIYKSNILLWARKETYHIINANNKYVSNLMIYNRKFEWDESSENPIVDVSFSIYNSNDTPVIFSGKYLVEFVLRDDPKNIIAIQPVSGKQFENWINPKDTLNISGRLTWFADDKYMPSLNIPGDELSLYSSFPHNGLGLLEIENIQRFSADFSKWNEDSIDDLMDILKFIKNRRGKFIFLKKGIGVSMASKKKNLRVYGAKYSCNFISNRNEDFYFLQRGEKISFVAEIFFKDSSIAENTFRNLKSNVKKAFSYDNQSFQDDEIKYEEYTYQGNVIMDIDFQYIKNMDEYRIKIEILE